MYELIEIKFSKIQGKGVFAKQNIIKGTKLCCDVILIDNSTVLKEYQYPWHKNISSICIGFGSYFNHSHNPNVKIYRVDKNKLTKTFITLKPISAGEELLIEYNKNLNYE